MNNYVTRGKWWGLCVLILTFISCSKNNSNQNDPKSFNVQADEVSSQGCLNVQKLLDRIHNFPTDTVGRILTTDIQAIGTEKTRETFLVRVVRGNFRLEEGPVGQILNLDHAVQNGCQSATLLNADGSGNDFTLSHFTSNTVELQSDDADTGPEDITLTLLDARSLQIETQTVGVDPCNNFSKSNVRMNEILKWGGQDILNASTEIVSTQMLTNLSHSTDHIPQGIVTLLSDPETKDATTVTVPLDDLKKLRDAEVKIEIRACFPPPPPAIPNPVDPNVTPSPSPTPSPTPHM